MEPLDYLEDNFNNLKRGLQVIEEVEIQKVQERFARLIKNYEPIQTATLAEKRRAARLEAPDFNIFHILGVQHLEDNTHSPFLAELLNPSGSHGQGDLFLKAFLENLSQTESLFPIPELDLGVGKWTIARELRIDGGFLDIVIRNKHLGCLYVIENKINAPEQPRQIERYQGWLNTQTRYSNRALIFLTPTGREPVSGNAFCLSYREDITFWLEETLDNIAATKVKETVHQYLEIIKAGKEEAMGYEDEVLKFLCQPENISAALEIAGYVEKMKNKTHWQFWSLMNRYLNTNYQASGHRNNWVFLQMSKKHVNNSYRGCHFIPKTCDKNPEVTCLQYCFRQHDLNSSGRFYFGIRWMQKQEELKEYDSPEFLILLEQLREQGYDAHLDWFWPAWRWLDFSPFSESFYFNMINNPETFVKQLAEDYWNLFINNVETVEAINDAVTGEFNKK